MFPGATYQTLMGLRHLHSHKLVHRDLSMQNILLHIPSNCAKIAGVGLAVCASNFVLDRPISTLWHRALEVFLGVQALDFEQTAFDMRPFASIMSALFLARICSGSAWRGPQDRASISWFCRNRLRSLAPLCPLGLTSRSCRGGHSTSLSSSCKCQAYPRTFLPD